MNRKPVSDTEPLQLAVLAIIVGALIVASIADALSAPALWTLVAIVGAGYLLGRGASQAQWHRLGQARTSGGDGSRVEDRGGGTDAMTVSEERLRVDKQPRVRERVRLRKYVVTEQVTVTVPVRREHLRLVREPIPEGESGAEEAELGASVPDYSVTLLEERVVVDKRVVPRERVTVHKEVVTEQEQISETVRREEVDIERDEIRQRGQSPPRGKEAT